MVGFNYVIELVPDNNYGALNLTTQKWNGLVKGFQIMLLLNWQHFVDNFKFQNLLMGQLMLPLEP